MKVRMVNTPSADSNNEPVACYVAIELSKSGWLVGFLTPLSDKTGRYQVKAGDAQALLDLIERVHTRVARQLNRPVEVMSCYEAGYDGFWLHRVLVASGPGSPWHSQSRSGSGQLAGEPASAPSEDGPNRRRPYAAGIDPISAWRAGGLQRGASSAGRRGRCQAPPPRAQAAGCRACAACQSHQRALRGTRHL